jgi:hypothetical protein
MLLFDQRPAASCCSGIVETHRQTETSSRTLKIEEEGDFWQRKIKPKIRLKGQWLERAGFIPGNHVNVACIAPGIIELRSDVAQSLGRRGAL